MEKMCIGEYDSVFGASQEKERLRRLHDTPCSKEEALAIVRWLVRVRPVYVGNFLLGRLQVVFAGKRGRAGIKRRPSGVVRPWISLPAPQYRFAATGKPCLRVGIVLHEYAHHLATLAVGHTRPFVQVLDALCVLFETSQVDRADLASGPPTGEIVANSYVKRGRCWQCGQSTTRRHSRLPGRYSCKKHE